MKRYNSKKGQSALEFLLTYGWAFLIIAIMIGALAYFGILNPEKFFPDRCQFGSEFNCLAHKLSASDGEVLFRIQNAAGGSINITNVTLSVDSATSLTCLSANAPIRDDDAANRTGNGKIQDYQFYNCDFDSVGYLSDAKEKVFVKIRWFELRSGERYTKETNGEIFSTII